MKRVSFTEHFVIPKLMALVAVQPAAMAVIIGAPSLRDPRVVAMVAVGCIVLALALLLHRRRVIDPERRVVRTVWSVGWPLVTSSRSWSEFGEVVIGRRWAYSQTGSTHNSGHNTFVVYLNGRRNLVVHRGDSYRSARRVADRLAALMGNWLNDDALDRGGRPPVYAGVPLRSALLHANWAERLGPPPPPPPRLRAKLGPEGLSATLQMPISIVSMLLYFGVVCAGVATLGLMFERSLPQASRVGGAAISAAVGLLLLVLALRRGGGRVDLHMGPGGARLHLIRGRSVEVRELLAADLIEVGLVLIGPREGYPGCIALISRDDVVLIGQRLSVQELLWLRSALCLAIVVDALGRPRGAA